MSSCRVPMTPFHRSSIVDQGVRICDLCGTSMFIALPSREESNLDERLDNFIIDKGWIMKPISDNHENAKKYICDACAKELEHE